METKKAYGIVTAIGTKLGEKARAEPELVERVRAAPDVASFREIVRVASEGVVPPALVGTFVDEIVAEADWVQWRSRLLLQMKLARDGGKPAPGHESGRGVQRT